MILIVSNAPREAALLSNLCDHRRWPCQPCATVSRLMTMSEQVQPRALVIRHRLPDGYSDDIFNFLKTASLPSRPRVIVLMGADCSPKDEARQVELGADCVMRDPVRIEVLLQYLARYQESEEAQAPVFPSEAFSYTVAGVEIFPREQRIHHAARSLHIAPQEVALLRMLARSKGNVVTYPMLYEELLGRKFAGDTTNCRVLLGKACSSFKQLGIDLKAHIQVIPKSGYLYSATLSKPAIPKAPASARSKTLKRRHASKS